MEKQKEIKTDVKIPKCGFRSLSLGDDAVNTEERTADLTFMTEAPCDNWWTPEVVICEDGSADLTRLNNKCMPLLFNHDRNKVIGTVESISFEENRAKATVKFFKDAESDNIFQKVLGGLRGVSVGYLRDLVTRVKAGMSFEGRSYEQETDVVTKWTPLEISIVSIPADADAGVGRSANGEAEEIIVRTLEGEAEEKAEPETKETEATETVAEKEMEESLMENKPEINVAAERAAAVTAERERVAKINEMCRGANVCTDAEIQGFINDGKSVEEVRTALFDKMCEKSKPSEVKFGTDYNDGEHLRAAIVDGLAMRHGMNVENPTEGAEKYRNLSMRSLAEICLENGGTRGTRYMSADELFKKVTKERAMGSEQFQGIIDNFAHMSLMKAYEEQPFIFKNFVSIGQNVDFKPTYRYEMGLSGLPELMAPESDEFKYQTMSDARVSTGIQTYGKAIEFNREIFINDQLGQVQRAIALQAAGFRRLQEKMFFDVLSKVTYSSSAGNLVKTNKDISAEAYGEMSRLMRTQKDLNGEGFIGVPPTYLLAPVEQEDLHRVLLTSSAAPGQANAGVTNVASGKFKLFTSPYLTGKAYYVLAAPGQMPGIEYTTLNGIDNPQSRTVVPAESLGLKIQMWMDFGFNVLSNKAFVKNEGTSIN